MSSPLVDTARLGDWLDTIGLASGAPVEVRPLVGGASNAMFIVNRGDHEWVLRRPAGVAIARADEGMRREFRMLDALDGSAVPHPTVIALCEDHDVLGCTFYLMDRIDGFNPMPGSLPDDFDTPERRRELTFAMVDALATLHDVDWVDRRLGEFDRTAGFHERQVTRWKDQLDGYGGRPLEGTDAVIDWLAKNIPNGFEPTIMHGDYHMMNVLIAPEPPARVAAILDWETATIGDPLLDLAGFCEIWTRLTDPGVDGGTGWPSRDEIIEHYRAERGLDTTPDLHQRCVLHNFRMAVLLEGIHQRSLTDPTREPMTAIGEQAARFMDRARELVD